MIGKLKGKKVSFKMIVYPDFGPAYTEEKKGRFLEFGINYEEMESGVGNFSSAIIIGKEGQLYNVAVESVQF